MHYTDYEKLSRRQRRLQDLKRRNSWGAVNPVTRIVESGKICNRARIKRETRDLLVL